MFKLQRGVTMKKKETKETKILKKIKDKKLNPVAGGGFVKNI